MPKYCTPNFRKLPNECPNHFLPAVCQQVLLKGPGALGSGSGFRVYCKSFQVSVVVSLKILLLVVEPTRVVYVFGRSKGSCPTTARSLEAFLQLQLANETWTVAVCIPDLGTQLDDLNLTLQMQSASKSSCVVGFRVKGGVRAIVA